MTSTAADMAKDLDHNKWSLDNQGHEIPQTSAESAIVELIDLLEVAAGDNILEIGTGSGFSTALLSRMTGTTGQVTSLDVVPRLVEMAKRKLKDRSVTNASVLVADGLKGYASAGPYDRMIAWATAPTLPSAWFDQLVTGARVVLPTRVAPVAAANAVMVATVDAGKATSPRLLPGGYIDMAPEEVVDFARPVYHLNASVSSESEQTQWISCPALRGEQESDAVKVIQSLSEEAKIASKLAVRQEEAQDFMMYAVCAADCPVSASGPQGRGLGVFSGGEVALCLYDGSILATGDRALQEMARIRSNWDESGKPGVADLNVALEPGVAGWEVKASV